MFVYHHQNHLFLTLSSIASTFYEKLLKIAPHYNQISDYDYFEKLKQTDSKFPCPSSQHNYTRSMTNEVADTGQPD